MFLIIVGAGAMGQIIRKCALKDEAFDRIEMVEPKDNNWPKEKADLIIDFSHPKAIKDLYEYCRNHGGGIPVIIGTTGQSSEDEEMIRLLTKICPVDRRTNFSRGIEALNELSRSAKKILGKCDIGIEEIHHNKKIDAPSGTAKTICDILEVPYESATSHRLGTMFGQHKVYFALEDEMIEITHTAYSKKIFAMGAIEAGKRLAGWKPEEGVE